MCVEGYEIEMNFEKAQLSYRFGMMVQIVYILTIKPLVLCAFPTSCSV